MCHQQYINTIAMSKFAQVQVTKTPFQCWVARGDQMLLTVRYILTSEIQRCVWGEGTSQNQWNIVRHR